MKKKNNEIIFALGAGLLSYFVFSSFRGTSSGGTTSGGTTSGGTSSGGTTSGGTSSGGFDITSGGLLDTVGVNFSAPIFTSGTKTIKYAQQRFNLLNDYLRNEGSPMPMWWSPFASLPANLVVDGLWGNNTKNAIKTMYAWYYNLTHLTSDKISPADTPASVLDASLDQMNIWFSVIYNF